VDPAPVETGAVVRDEVDEESAALVRQWSAAPLRVPFLLTADHGLATSRSPSPRRPAEHRRPLQLEESPTQPAAKSRSFIVSLTPLIPWPTVFSRELRGCD
jgi:hypothetical protein